MDFLMKAVQEALSATGSMEDRYLSEISLLDKAETLANTMVAEDGMAPELAVQLAEVKQAMITDFARANADLTLAKIRQRAEEAAKMGQIELEEIKEE